MLEARDELRTATKTVAIKGDALSADLMMRGPGRNRAAGMPRERATARVTYARYRNPLNLEVGGAGAYYLATVRCGIAKSNDVLHDYLASGKA